MPSEQFEHEYDIEALELITPAKRSFQMYVAPRFVDHYCKEPYEDFTSDLLLHHIKDGALFVDIGAHYGYYSLLVGSAFPSCNIVSFEPVPGNYEVFKRNIELNGLTNITAHRMAVSHGEGKRKFKITAASDNCGFYGHPSSGNINEIEVETVRLERFISEAGNRDVVIKIDTEGHDLHVLDGMAGFLRENANVKLIIEFNPKCILKAGYQPADLLRKIEELEFDIYFINDESRLFYKLDMSRIENWMDYMQDYQTGYLNIFCIKKQKSLNICFFSHSGNLLGAERSMAELVKELIDDCGAMVTVCVPFDGPLKAKLSESGAAVLPVDYYWWCDWQPIAEKEAQSRLIHSYLSTLHFLSLKLKLVNPDVIVTNSLVIPWGAIAAVMLNKPHAWFVREYGEMDHDFKFFQPFIQILKIIEESSNNIFTVSKSVRDLLFPSVDNRHIYPVYTHFAAPGDTDGEDGVAFSSGPGVIKLIIVAAVIKTKGQMDAVMAVKELANRGYQSELLVLGTINDDYGQSLRETIASENLEEQVKMAGWQGNPYPAMQQADIVLVCSRHEAFGRSTAEAMMMKKPVIGTNSGGTTELIRDGVNGFLYEPGNYRQLADKIEYFMVHRDDIARFGMNGYKYVVDNFTRQNFGAKVYRLLQEIRVCDNPLTSEFTRFINGLNTSALADMDDTLKQQNMRIEANEILLSRLNQSSNTLELSLLDKNNQLRQAEKRQEDSNRQLNEFRVAYEAVTGSVSWRLIKKMHRIIDFILPLNSKLRMLASRIMMRASHPGQLFKYLNPVALVRYFHFMNSTDAATFQGVLNGAVSAAGIAATAGKGIDISHPESMASLDEVPDLYFPISDNPNLSVILDVSGKWQYAYSCLASLYHNLSGINHEVIVSGNDIRPETMQLLNKMKGIRILQPGEMDGKENWSKAAHGEYILILDSNNYIYENAVESMLIVFKNDKSAGIVGPKLVFNKSRLKSAGCMLEKHGTGYCMVDIGHGRDPQNYEYNFLKEVDCFRSCFIIRRDVLEKSTRELIKTIADGQGGLDLAFAARSLGYRVIYQPEASVLSWEDTAQDARPVPVNAGMQHRWQAELDADLLEGKRDLFLGRDRTQHKRHLLFIEYNLPAWDKDAGSLSIYTYLKLFLELGYRITYLPDCLQAAFPYTLYLQQMGIEVIYGTFDYNQWIEENGQHIDITFIARPPLPLKYMDSLRKHTSAGIIYYNVDLQYLRESRRFEIEKNEKGLAACLKQKEIEFRIMNGVDITLTPSSAEKNMLLKELPDKIIEDIPVYIFDNFPADHINTPFEHRHGLLFLGGFLHSPNVDAVLWFVREVYPLISSRLPGLKLIIAGSEPPREIMELASHDIQVTGYIDDLEPYFASARVFIAPLRYGAGVKGKIITSLAHGLPAVITSIGNEGLDMIDGEQAFISDDAAGFADKVIQLYSDKERWLNISSGGLNFVKDNYSRECALEKLKQIIGMIKHI